MEKEFIRLKWGVGRMIYESPKLPIIIPIWHEGMDSVLPNTPPYYLRFGKKVTVNIGKPIQLSSLVQSLKERNVQEPEARKLITDKIQEELLVSSVPSLLSHLTNKRYEANRSICFLPGIKARDGNVAFEVLTLVN